MDGVNNGIQICSQHTVRWKPGRQSSLYSKAEMTIQANSRGRKTTTTLIPRPWRHVVSQRSVLQLFGTLNIDAAALQYVPLTLVTHRNDSNCTYIGNYVAGSIWIYESKTGVNVHPLRKWHRKFSILIE